MAEKQATLEKVPDEPTAIEDTTDRILERARARRRLRAVPAACRAAREQAGLTQGDVAEALGVSRSSVSRWESGLTVPHGGQAAEYLDLLRRASGEVASP